MADETNLQEMESYLRDVLPEKSFWVSNGRIIRNIYELASVIENMNYDIFKYHVAIDKNYFSKWVGEVLGDKNLAGEMLNAKTKEATFKIIKKRINAIEEHIYKEKLKWNAKETTENLFSKDNFTLANLLTAFGLGIVAGIVIGAFVFSYFS